MQARDRRPRGRPWCRSATSGAPRSLALSLPRAGRPRCAVASERPCPRVRPHASRTRSAPTSARGGAQSRPAHLLKPCPHSGSTVRSRLRVHGGTAQASASPRPALATRAPEPRRTATRLPGPASRTGRPSLRERPPQAQGRPARQAPQPARQPARPPAAAHPYALRRRAGAAGTSTGRRSPAPLRSRAARSRRTAPCGRRRRSARLSRPLRPP